MFKKLYDYLMSPFHYYYKYNQKSLDEMYALYKKGEYKNTVVKFFNRLPNITYLWGMEEGYDRDTKKYGDEVFFGPGWRPSWWRQFYHVLGGMFVAVVPAYHRVPLWILPALTAFLISLKEMKDNAGSIKKRAWDISMWVLGTLLMTYLIQL